MRKWCGALMLLGSVGAFLSVVGTADQFSLGSHIDHIRDWTFGCQLIVGVGILGTTEILGRVALVAAAVRVTNITIWWLDPLWLLSSDLYFLSEAIECGVMFIWVLRVGRFLKSNNAVGFGALGGRRAALVIASFLVAYAAFDMIILFLWMLAVNDIGPDAMILFFFLSEELRLVMLVVELVSWPCMGFAFLRVRGA